jgi:renalase
MRVAVVGAGLSGLAAARELTANGHEVIVFEKSRGLGGRLASRRAEGTVVDHGSPVIAAPPGSALRALVDELDIDDRVDLADGIAFSGGATRLPKLMASALDVRRGVRLTALRGATASFELGDEQGNSHGSVDAVVVTAPAPQAADLLERSPESAERVNALRALPYAPAVMVLLGVRTGEPWSSDPPWPTPVGSVYSEALKGRPSPDGVAPFVVRLDAEASVRLLDASDEEIVAASLPALASIIGEAAQTPAWIQVKRWRLAVPVGTADADAVNPAGSRIVMAGDTLTGAGFGTADHYRIYDSGIQAAQRLMA